MDPTVARTARMVLRPLTLADAVPLTAVRGLLAEDEKENRDWIATWCVQQQTLHGLGYWGCWRSADQRLVAFCGWRPHDFGIALGFGVAADFRKQGYASEAAALPWTGPCPGTGLTPCSPASGHRIPLPWRSW